MGFSSFSSTFLPWLLTLILLVLSLTLCKFFLLKQSKKSAKFPPGPRKLPIIGNLHQLGKIPHYSLWKLSHKHGPIMLLKLGRVPTLVVSTPELAKQVLRTHDLDCCTRPLSWGQRKLSYNFLDLAFSPYGEYWREMRKLCVIELLTNKRVQSFWKVREAEIGHLIGSLSEASPNPVDLSDAILNLTNNVIRKIAFGTNHRESQFEYGTLKDIIDDTMVLLSGLAASDFFPAAGGVLDWVTGLRRKVDKTFRNLDAFLEAALEAHLDPAWRPKQHEDIIDVMLGLAKDRTTVVHLTKDHMKAILLDIFLGSIVTSSVTIIWAMAELAKNPRAMKKAQAQIRSCIGRKPKVDEAELDKLTYLKLVVKETLRLHPPASLLLPHETIRHCQIGGYSINPKTRILVNAWAIGRDPKIWTDPEEFIPERFENSPIDFIGHNFELLPFGSGRRMCPGINMATVSVEFTLANLLHCLNWKLPDWMKEEELSMEEEFGLTIRKKVPLLLVPVNYNWQEDYAG
ncbi:cytochrome P450 71B10-like isoform X1 [Diospyros lotus]|uniref:cytochrome P450 71B10-like isoform X1 n=1 Tax=Diospyros lotus TaxID=55363 RepID=UPI00225B2467|nr:cytochrome P450 71B10-like isoform X1 [Diospyros lotus]